MNKKVVVFGGGTGMSYLLRGLKQYPLDITAVVSVCDDGGSTGILRDEFNMLAVGDIRKVLISLSKTDESTMDLSFKTLLDICDNIHCMETKINLIHLLHNIGYDEDDDEIKL